MARTPPPTAIASLRRWLAGWLVLALCAQALSAAGALWRPMHRHAPAVQENVQRVLLWRHDRDTPAAASMRDAHARAHADGLAHEHAVNDPSVLPNGSDAAADAASLAAFFAAPPPRTRALAAKPLRHVWAASTHWASTARTIAPLRRPPRG
ncbi:MAG: hypothetical protein HS128_04465 [Ideonella sp.]|nr:hypothetical protein [Ideonella sp.]MCC7455450.1 hypothetical protein [Nitrospira sp.]